MRIITRSEYLAHTEPLFKQLELLQVQDLYKLKLLKFYYNLSYGMLPSYFDLYINTINSDIPYSYEFRTSMRPLIRITRTRLVFSESSLLYQLILLLNNTHECSPELLLKIDQRSHTFAGFSFNVTRHYLSTYNIQCTKRICFSCGRP